MPGPGRDDKPDESLFGHAILRYNDVPAPGRADIARLAVPSPQTGTWEIALGDHGAARYSPLAQITRENVEHLRLAWRYETGAVRGHEATPLVVDGTMYIVLPFPNELIALDLTQPGPVVKWRYTPDPAKAAQGVACWTT